jgi:hypothetical protein
MTELAAVAADIAGAGRQLTGLGACEGWNSHLAVHDDHRRRRGVDHHAVAHAQPRGLVFLSHLPDVTTTAELDARQMRWERAAITRAVSGPDR